MSFDKTGLEKSMQEAVAPGPKAARPIVLIGAGGNCA